MYESIKVSCIIDKLPPSWKDFKHTLKHLKVELTRIELGSHLYIEESLRAQDNDKPKGNNVAGPSVVYIVGHNNSSRYNENKGKCKHHETKANPNKKPKVTCWKCGKPGHLKKDCKAGNVGNKANGSGIKGSEDGSSNPLKGQSMFNKSHQVYYVTYVSEAFFVQDDDVAWWVDSRATMHVCKYRCLFKTYESLNDGFINSSTWEMESTTLYRNSFKSTSKLNDLILWHARLGHVHFKRMQDMSKDGLIPAFDMDTKKCQTCVQNKITKKPFQNVKCETEVLELIHNDLCDLHATPSLEQKYAEHSKSYRFYVIEPNDSVAINSIIELRDAIFDEHRFSSVPRPIQRSLVKGTEDFGGSVVPKNITDEIVQQSEPELRKSKRHRTSKDFRPEFQLYFIEETRDEVSYQYSYCFNVEDDPKTFDEAMKSQNVAFWKEAINDEIDSIMGNNTWVLTNLPPGCRPLGCKWIFKRKMKVDMTKEFLSSRFSMKDMGEADVILGIRIKHESNGIAISQSHYIKKVLKKFSYSDCTPVSTPLDTCKKLMPNRGLAVS
ncbi:zinc finger, CCHC-type containing protein [Tanacetum coccineum]